MGSIRHIFTPEGTISIIELKNVLMSKRLGRRWPRPQSASTPSQPLGKGEVRALARCEEDLIEDLKSSKLVAHSYVPGTAVYNRISAGFWQDVAGRAALSGMMHQPKDGLEYDGNNPQSVVVLKENADDWLFKNGVWYLDELFPDVLLPQDPAIRSKKKSPYNWHQFEQEALEVLQQNGEYAYDWKQARLEERMLIWCTPNFDREPSRKLVRDHVKIAYARYVREKKGGLE